MLVDIEKTKTIYNLLERKRELEMDLNKLKELVAYAKLVLS
jgi:hypothetical protein